MQRLLKSEFLINKKAEDGKELPKYSVCFVDLANYLSTSEISTSSELDETEQIDLCRPETKGSVGIETGNGQVENIPVDQ
jgi:hypothetical protein